MPKTNKILIFIILLSNALYINSFDKVIIWGHKLHSHTHSYIHNAFYNAFNHLGYQTYWFDDNDNVSSFNFANSLFLTEGQVDSKIPLRNDCKYILHNPQGNKYINSLKPNNYIYLDVYTDILLNKPSCKKIDECIYYDLENRYIYFPWATDLLPHQIDENKIKVISNFKKKSRYVYWVGSFGDGIFGNIDQLNPFIKELEKHKLIFKHSSPWVKGISVDENMNLIMNSYMAPAIVGKWQKEKGYIPCRIFKNISYGQMGITNSYRTYELFNKKIVYNSDEKKLFYDALNKIKAMKVEELLELMDFVKNKHTYINRINNLLNFLKLYEEK